MIESINMKTNKFIFISLFFLFILGPLSSQSANKITEILSTQNVTYGQACYLIGISMELIPENLSDQEAVDVFISKGYIKQTSASAYINLEDFSWICSKAWKFRTGLMSKIFRNKHYVFKDLKSLNILKPNDDPHQKITGQKALNIITKFIELTETGE